ncbi:putative guanine nucleotide exchange factor MCF2L2 [Anopheles sinensis]|uniref:Putative guanine nucleotide exchange factor MCF2L2 n=1 Tax=Anopheles sinensis TaxID=74873 RepID=A0A084W1K6_ANOSI|nr:putative guanine nucleotide exchange factor MCF2L2 [Anopheles sinensis]
MLSKQAAYRQRRGPGEVAGEHEGENAGITTPSVHMPPEESRIPENLRLNASKMNAITEAIVNPVAFV